MTAWRLIEPIVDIVTGTSETSDQRLPTGDGSVYNECFFLRQHKKQGHQWTQRKFSQISMPF